MNRNKIKGIILLFMSLLILVFIAFCSLNVEEVKSKKLCVDGNHNINLEGIMCEDISISFYGIDEKIFGLFSLIMILSFILLFLVGFMFLIMGDKE